MIEVLLRNEAVHVTDLPLPEADRNLLASILMKDDEELSAERLEGAVRALRRIQLRRKLERVQRELQVARGQEAGPNAGPVAGKDAAEARSDGPRAWPTTAPAARPA